MGDEELNQSARTLNGVTAAGPAASQGGSTAARHLVAGSSSGPSSPPVFSPTPPPPPGAAVGATAALPTAYNDKVVAFVRQPNVIDLLKEKRPAMMANKSIRDKIFAVRQDGNAALERLSHDVELTILLRYGKLQRL